MRCRAEEEEEDEEILYLSDVFVREVILDELSDITDGPVA